MGNSPCLRLLPGTGTVGMGATTTDRSQCANYTNLSNGYVTLSILTKPNFNKR